jgi:type II secretory pathway component HofQ
MLKSALFAVVVCAALGAMIVTAVAQQEDAPRQGSQRTEADREAAAERAARFRAAREAQQQGEEGQPAAEGQPFRGRQPAVGGQRENPLGDGGDSRFGTRSRRAEVQAVAAPASPGRAVTIELLMVELSADAKDAKAAIDLGASADDIRLTVEKLAGEGKLQLVSHIRLSTLEQLPATFQVGEMVPVVTGRQVVGGGRGGVATAASVSYENVGTIVSVTPGIDGDDAILEITAEKSRVENQQMPETDDASTPLPPRRSTSTVRSTVRVPNGSYVVAGGATFAGDDGRKEMLVLVTARF